MHWIEKSVLEQLTHTAAARNSQLRPDGVESNLFQYHLKNLLKAGLVTKQADGQYALGPEGIAWADRFSGNLHAPRPQAKIMTALILNDDLGNTLFIQKARQPFIGKYVLPSGKVHVGEPLDAAARREAHEKVGLLDPPLIPRGIYHLRSSGEAGIDHLIFAYSGRLPASFAPSSSMLLAKPAEEPGDVFAPGTADICAEHQQQLFVQEIVF